MARRIPCLTVAALVWMTSFGCNAQLSPQAKELLLSGYRSYEAGDHGATVQRTGAFLADKANQRRADEAYYLRGLARYRLKDLPGAKADLNEALGRTRHKKIRVNALNALGDIAYDTGNMPLAENMYRQALAQTESGEKASGHSHYRLGCVLQRQGRWGEADLQFDRVIYMFGGSRLAAIAERHVRCKAWTIQVGAFSQKAPADTVASGLRARKFVSFTEPVATGGRLMFVVHVGRYLTYGQANARLANVRRHEPGAFVTVTR